MPRYYLLPTLIVMAVILLPTAIISHGSDVPDDLMMTFGYPIVAVIDTGLKSASGALMNEAGNYVLIAGTINGSPVLTYVNLTNLRGSRNYYPLLGSVSVMDSDSLLKPKYYAVGTKRGEILVFTSSNPHKPLLKYIQGEEGVVERVYVSNSGILISKYSVRNLVLVKVFKVGLAGWTEIGEFGGNASLSSIAGRFVVDALLVKKFLGNDVVSGNVMLLIYYTLPTYKLRVKVINAENRTPLANVKVYVENMDTGEVFYGITDPNGYALVPISIPAKNIAIYVSYGGVCYRSEFKDVRLRRVSNYVFDLRNVITVPTATVGSCPVVKHMYVLEFNKVQGNSVVRIGVANISDAVTLNVHAFLDISRLNLGYKYLVITSGRFTDYPTLTQVRMLYIDDSYNIVKVVSYRLPSPVSYVAYSRDGSVITLGTKGGTVYVFVLDGDIHKVFWSYVMPSAITSLCVAGSNNSYALLIGDAKGDIQVLYSSDLHHELYPVSRANTSLTLMLKDEIMGIHSTLNVNKVVIVSRSTTYIILGLGKALNKGIVSIDLNERILQPLLIRVSDPSGKGVAHAYVGLKTPLGALLNITTDTNGTAQIKYVLPGTYEVLVKPPQDYLNVVRSKVRIKPNTKSLSLTCNYRPTTVKFMLRDTLTGTAPQENVILILKSPIYKNVSKYVITPLNSSFTLALMPGKYNVTVKPYPYIRGKPLYSDYSTEINVPKVRNVLIRLRRNNFTLTLILLDEVTKGPPREDIQVNISTIEGMVLYSKVTRKPVVVLSLPYKGLLNIYLKSRPLKNEEPMYVEEIYTINLLSDMRKIAFLHLNNITLALILRDKESGGPPVSDLDIFIDGKYYMRVPKGTNIAYINVTKGVHELLIKSLPTPKTLNLSMYNETLIKVKVLKPTILNITLSRMLTNATFIIKDYYSGGGPIESINVYVDGIRAAKLKPKPEKYLIINIPVPKGLNIISVKSKEVYMPVTKKVKIVKPQKIILELMRRAFTVKVTVVNDLGRPVYGGVVEAVGIGLKFRGSSSIVNGEADLRLPYGAYTLVIKQPGYEVVTIERVVTSNEEFSIVLRPTPYTLISRYILIFIGITIIALVLILIYKYRARIKSLIAPEEEIF